MPDTSLLAIINPTSGSAQAVSDDFDDSLRVALEARDYHVTLRHTEAKGDAKSWAQAAAEEGFTAVLVAGGDGTLMEVVGGVVEAERRVPVWPIPMGTGNLLARSLQLSEDPLEALEQLLDGESMAFDVGYIRNKAHYFLVAAGAGVDADTMRDADGDAKRKLGRFAYVIASLRNLFKRRRHSIRLQILESYETQDDSRKASSENATQNEDASQEQTIILRAHTVMIFNSSEVGPFNLGPGVTPHDGKLEIAVLRHTDLWSLLGDAWHLLFGTLHKRRTLQSYSVHKAHIDADPPLLTQADGDVLGDTPLDIEVLAKAVDIRIPQRYLKELANKQQRLDKSKS